MAKKSLINKNIFIYKNYIKYYKKKIIIKKIIKKNNSIFNYFKLQKNKNFFITKFKNRCYISGSPRSYYRYFNLNRNFIRKIGSFGYITGLTKSSW